jgi:hypothetical protein
MIGLDSVSPTANAHLTLLSCLIRSIGKTPAHVSLKNRLSLIRTSQRLDLLLSTSGKISSPELCSSLWLNGMSRGASEVYPRRS